MRRGWRACENRGMKWLAWLGAIFYFGQSLIYWFWLPPLLPGVAFATPADRVGVLTMFAGLTLGIGAAVAVLAWVRRYAEAIVVALLATTGLAVVRGLGMVLGDAVSPGQLVHFGLELLAPLIGAILWPQLKAELTLHRK